MSVVDPDERLDAILGMLNPLTDFESQVIWTKEQIKELIADAYETGYLYGSGYRPKDKATSEEVAERTH